VLPRIAVFAACVSYWISADKKEALVNASQLSLAFGILSLIADAAAADGIVFVQDGTPKASIVVPEAASPTERFAAEEIQRYIEKMSGAKLPIVSDGLVSGSPLISIGKTEHAPTTVDSAMPGDDPYIMRTVGETLVLLGKGDRGTIYAAYHFLEEHLGCRWVFPGELGDVIPKRTDIEIGKIDEHCEPAFRFRIAGGFGYTDCIDWAIKHRMHIYSPSPTVWQSEELTKRGGCVKGAMSHAFHRLFPPEQYFDRQPDLYGLIGGQRVASLTRGQLCISNPDAVRLTAEKAIQFFDENPDADFFSLCPDDHQNWCECKNCTAFDTTTMERWGRSYPVVSDRLMAFVNKVGEQLEEKHPDKLLYVFAYQNYTDPPLKHLPKKNVIVSLCHMVPACYAHPLEDPECEKNVAFMTLLNGWSKAHTNMWYYAYTCKSMWQDMPWPIARRLAKDVRTLHGHGFQGFYSQGSGMRWGQLGVNMYLMAKMLWDVDTDADAVLDDYFQHSFGPAADAVKGYYSLIEKEFSQPGIYIHHEAREQAPRFLTPEIFERCFGYLDSAEQAAAGDDRILARITPIRVALDYARLYLEADRHETAFRQTDSDEELKNAIDAYLQILQLQKEHGFQAISDSGVRRYVKTPLEKLQLARFARTGETDGLAIEWETQNLLKNPSFEEGTDNEPVAWRGMGTSSRGSSVLTEEHARTGRRSLAMRAIKKTDVPDETGFWKADWIAAQTLGQRIPVRAGEVYRLMAWINVPDDFTATKRGVTLGIVGYDQNGKSPARWTPGSIEVKRTKRTGAWQRIAIFKKIDDPKIKSFAVRLGIAGTGEVFFDDIELVRGKEFAAGAKTLSEADTAVKSKTGPGLERLQFAYQSVYLEQVLTEPKDAM